MKTLFDNVLRKAKARSISEAVPRDALMGMGCRLYTLMNLAWGYVETVCDLSAQMRVWETKSLVRAVRRLKASYDKFRGSTMTLDNERREEERGERFEEACSSDFNKLFHGLQAEIGKLGLSEGHYQLVLAVQQALTVMDAVKEYSGRVDRRLREEHGFRAPDHCMIQEDFMKLYGLVHMFAGDCYKPDLEARRLTAVILANRLEAIDIMSEEDGRMVDPGRRP